MTVSVVTIRKGGTREAMIAATQTLKAAVEENGAEDVMLSQVAAGPDAGQWIIRILFDDWEDFGKTMQSASSDPALREAVAGLDAISEVVSRRLLSGVEL